MTHPNPVPFDVTREIVQGAFQLQVPDLARFVMNILKIEAFRNGPDSEEIYSIDCIRGGVVELVYLLRHPSLRSPFHRMILTPLVLCALFRRASFATCESLKELNVTTSNTPKFVGDLRALVHKCNLTPHSTPVRIEFPPRIPEHRYCPILVDAAQWDSELSEKVHSCHRRRWVNVCDERVCCLKIVLALRAGSPVVVLTRDPRWLLDHIMAAGNTMALGTAKLTIIVAETASPYALQAAPSIERLRSVAPSAGLDSASIEFVFSRSGAYDDRLVQLGNREILHSFDRDGTEFMVLTQDSMTEHFRAARDRISSSLRSAVTLWEAFHA